MCLCESILKTLGPHYALYLRRIDSWAPHIGAGRRGGATGFLGRGSALDTASRLSFLVDKGRVAGDRATGQRGPSVASMSSEKGEFLSGLGGMGLLWDLFHSLFTTPLTPTMAGEVRPQGSLYSCHCYSISALEKPT